MRKINQTLSILTVISIIAISCQSGSDLESRKAELAEAKNQLSELKVTIKNLEDEIARMDTTTEEEAAALVAVYTFKPEVFTHEVEVRGSIESRKNVTLSAETMGRITSVQVKEGQKVSKGQLLIQLDADVVRNNISEVETQLELATTIFERQSKLWKQNVGTEVQYLQAKNNKESLESRLATLKSQLRMSAVYAPFAGVVDNVPARVGQMAQPGLPLLRIMNQEDMYIIADISESFLGKFKDGQQAEVYFPAQNKTVQTTINSVGQVIKTDNRTFEIDLDMPEADFSVKPNQVAVVKLVDYKNENAFVVPTKIIQNDSRGSYLYEIVTSGGVSKARKIYVKAGLSYGLTTEIVAGVKEGLVIAREGYRELSQDLIVSVK